MTWKNAALLLCGAQLDTPCGCEGCPLGTDETDEEGNYLCALNEIEAEKLVKKQPAIQPQRGEWSTIGLCSVCNGEAPYNESGFWYESNYCPNCGADMRGEEDD